MSPASARHRLGAMRRVHGLPRLRCAVARGVIVGWHAQAVVTDLRHLPPAGRREVVDVLLGKVRDRRRRGLRDWTATDLRAQAKRIAAALDLDLAARRRASHRGRGCGYSSGVRGRRRSPLTWLMTSRPVSSSG